MENSGFKCSNIKLTVLQITLMVLHFQGQQHMRWSREGLDPLLQLRAAIGSNDWDKIWRTAVMNAILAQ